MGNDIFYRDWRERINAEVTHNRGKSGSARRDLRMVSPDTTFTGSKSVINRRSSSAPSVSVTGTDHHCSRDLFVYRRANAFVITHRKSLTAAFRHVDIRRSGM
jgi:hypothetical protein